MLPANSQVQFHRLSRHHLNNTRAWANDLDLQKSMLRTSYVSEKDQEEWYEQLRKDPKKLVFAIHETNSKCHIGNTGLYNIDTQNRRADFWILIGDKSSQNKGIGSSASFLLLEYAFNVLSLNRIQLIVSQTNKRAISLYEKFRFQHEGIMREYCVVHGQKVDVRLMALLRTDYDLQKRR